MSIIIVTRYSTASSVDHFFSTRANHTLIRSVAVQPTCSAIWYLTLLFLPKPDKHVTFGTVHCIWGGSDPLKTFRSQMDLSQHDRWITLKLQPEFQAPLSIAHELWLSFYYVGRILCIRAPVYYSSRNLQIAEQACDPFGTTSFRSNRFCLPVQRTIVPGTRRQAARKAMNVHRWLARSMNSSSRQSSQWSLDAIWRNSDLNPVCLMAVLSLKHATSD